MGGKQDKGIGEQKSGSLDWLWQSKVALAHKQNYIKVVFTYVYTLRSCS